jgi:uncharacterized surface protein with fasciclin (FAS1) repeats
MIKTKVLSILATSVLIAASITACGDDDDAAATGGNADGADADGADEDGADEDGADEDGADEDGDETTGAGAGGGDECLDIASLLEPGLGFDSLAGAAEVAGLTETIVGLTDATIFAPTDAAFAALIGEDGLDVEFSALTKEQLGPILAYHVITSGAVDGETALGLTKATTLGGDITLEAKDGGLVIDGSANVDLSSEGASYDIETCQGLVHVIDAVLVPSVADIVTSDFGSTGDYKGLYDTTAAATSTDDLVSALEETPTITVFAPTNAAFEALSSVPDADTLDTVIKYHVYNGEDAVYAATAVTLDTDITMLAGGDVTVDGDAEAGTVKLTDGSSNESNVVVTDVYASNGVVHRVDAVLIPAAD